MAAVNQHTRVFQFGAFELNTQSGELRKHGIKLKLQQQPLQILTSLLERQGEVVARVRLCPPTLPDNSPSTALW